MPKIITIANSKGGVGKTTLTLNLYQYIKSQGAKVAICDTDHQKSISNLGKMLDLVAPSQLTRSSYKFIIVDTPAYLAEETRKILNDSDFLLIPVKASILDCRAAITVVKEARKIGVPFALVLNMVKQGTKFTSEIREWLEDQNLPVFQTQISDRVAYARSLLYDSLEDEENAKANNEIRDLTNEILTALI